MESTKILIPIEFNEMYGGCVCITRGVDRTLSIYFKDKFDEMAEKIKELSTAESGAAKFVLSGVEEIRVSEDGELLIPDFFIDYMGGEGECSFIRFAEGIRLSRNS